MTDDERAELLAARADLQAEEAQQRTERGYTSQRILRAAARLDRLLNERPAHGN